MITKNDIITVTIPKEHLEILKYNAQQATIGGRSSVRGRSERMSNIQIDQMIGQLGNCAGILYLLGSIEPYLQIREQANRHRYEGDNGSDIPGYRVDIKTSLMRGSQNPLSYRLAVRPAERHKDTVYILALSESVHYNEVFLVGWALEKDLPDLPDKTGDFQGAYTIYSTDLRQMCEFDLEKFKE